MTPIFSDYAVSVTDLKRNFSDIVAQNNGAVAVLNHNKPEAYLLSAKHYQELLNLIEDLQDAQIVRERMHEKPVKVLLDEL